MISLVLAWVSFCTDIALSRQFQKSIHSLRRHQMTAMASRITGQSMVCSTVCSDWRRRDRWITHTKRLYSGKCSIHNAIMLHISTYRSRDDDAMAWTWAPYIGPFGVIYRGWGCPSRRAMYVEPWYFRWWWFEKVKNKQSSSAWFETPWRSYELICKTLCRDCGYQSSNEIYNYSHMVFPFCHISTHTLFVR